MSDSPRAVACFLLLTFMFCGFSFIGCTTPDGPPHQTQDALPTPAAVDDQYDGILAYDGESVDVAATDANSPCLSSAGHSANGGPFMDFPVCTNGVMSGTTVGAGEPFEACDQIRHTCHIITDECSQSGGSVSCSSPVFDCGTGPMCTQISTAFFANGALFAQEQIAISPTSVVVAGAVESPFASTTATVVCSVRENLTAFSPPTTVFTGPVRSFTLQAAPDGTFFAFVVTFAGDLKIFRLSLDPTGGLLSTELSAQFADGAPTNVNYVSAAFEPMPGGSSGNFETAIATNRCLPNCSSPTSDSEIVFNVSLDGMHFGHDIFVDTSMLNNTFAIARFGPAGPSDDVLAVAYYSATDSVNEHISARLGVDNHDGTFSLSQPFAVTGPFPQAPTDPNRPLPNYTGGRNLDGFFNQNKAYVLYTQNGADARLKLATFTVPAFLKTGVDVSETSTGLLFKRNTGGGYAASFTLKVTNIHKDGTVFTGPMFLFAKGLPPDVTLANSMSIFPGYPFVNLTSNSLMPGQSALASIVLRAGSVAELKQALTSSTFSAVSIR